MSSTTPRCARRWGRWNDRARRGGRLVARTARQALHDRLHGLAAEASFWTMLSLPPLLLALLTLVGPLGDLLGEDLAEQSGHCGPALGQHHFHRIDGAGSSPAAGRDRLVRRRFRDPVVEPVLVALWSGSAALSKYLTAITVAYDMDGLRSFWRTRLLSLVI